MTPEHELDLRAAYRYGGQDCMAVFAAASKDYWETEGYDSLDGLTGREGYGMAMAMLQVHLRAWKESAGGRFDTFDLGAKIQQGEAG